MWYRRRIALTDIVTNGEKIESLEERLTGRYAAEDIINPKTKEVMVKHHQLIDEKTAHKVVECGLKKVKIRSLLTCRSRTGVCAKCYGLNLATGKSVMLERLCIIAAQSIGEPGTQLTMRTFHTGGVAGDDITQGLPRVEELLKQESQRALPLFQKSPVQFCVKPRKT